MHTVRIYEDGTIAVDGVNTGYRVEQQMVGTRIVEWHNNGVEKPRNLGTHIVMPLNRYCLDSCLGRTQFDSDLLALFGMTAQ